MTIIGHIFAPVFPRSADDGKKIVETSVEPKKVEGKTSGVTQEKEMDDLLKIIKMSNYKIVEKLLQTPSKISILALLMNSSAHRESLMKVLNQEFVDYDVPLETFNSVVGNITACNNLSFSDEELPAEGKNHNMTLHISMHCKNDALSYVLI